MAKVHVVARRDHLESLTTATPLVALAELVWNGFDAGSNRVQVFFDLNDIDAIQSVRIRDYGTGIVHSEVENLFGNLGESWKKAKDRQNGRALHGKNGKGRFKAFALGERVEWRTTYQDTKSELDYSTLFSGIATFPVLEEAPDQGRRPLD